MEGTPPPRQPGVPAGWYPNPTGDGQRYWDGSAWTEHTVPQAPGAADPHAAAAGSGAEGDQPGTLEWTLSTLLPILPLAGLIWGVYLKRQGPAMDNPANLAIVLSLAMILIAVLLLR